MAIVAMVVVVLLLLLRQAVCVLLLLCRRAMLNWRWWLLLVCVGRLLVLGERGICGEAGSGSKGCCLCRSAYGPCICVCNMCVYRVRACV